MTAAFLAPVASPLRAAEITAERSPHGVTVKIDGQLFTEYLTNSGTKPVLWPIIGPSGKPVTRPWPIEGGAPVRGSQQTKDHPHHRSLWFTHGSVNGIDFWTETPANKRGRVVHRDFVKIASGPVAEIVARHDWLSPQGKKVLEDQCRMLFGAKGDARWIDYTIALRASEGPVKFGDTKEGAFGLRVADSIRVDAKQGGQIVNSRGQTDGDAWAQPAEWVDYHGPLEGQTVGIAIMNHPSSFRYPTRWHVRTYGLFAANPFGEREFAGDSSHGVSCTLPQGKEIVLRYRVLLHPGDEKQGRVAEAFAEYGKESAAVAAGPYVMAIDGEKTGDLPRGWTAAKTGSGSGSVWKVLADSDGRKVLAQTSDQGPNRLFNLCIAENTSFADVELAVSFKAVAGKLDQGGGLVWRLRDANNYYIARMNPLENNFRVYKVVDGKRIQLGTADAKAAAGHWHTLRVVHKGDHIKCYLEGKAYLDVKDDTFKGAGKVGLWTKADAQTYFGELLATEPVEQKR